MSIMADILASFRRLPVAVQAWVALWLGPVNIATLAFLGQRNGVLVAVLALGGMVPNLIIMIRERGLSALMALPHLVIWTPLVIVIVITLFSGVGSGYAIFLVLLLVTDVVSLIFDAKDFIAWRAGDRAIA